MEIAAGTFDDVLLPGEKDCFIQELKDNTQRESNENKSDKNQT
jgi:hypothetical protein